MARHEDLNDREHEGPYHGTYLFIKEFNNIPIWHFSSEIFMYLFLEMNKKVKTEIAKNEKFNLHTILDENMIIIQS